MVKMINLFNLHSKEDTPNSWIWISLDSHLIKKIYSSLLKNSTQNQIGKKISEKLNAGYSTVVKHLIRIKKTKKNLQIPLPIIIELNNLSNKDYSIKLLNSIYYLYSINYNSQRIKPVHNINPMLSKIIGAHVSDGYLQKYKKSYSWKVCEGKKDIVCRLALWIKNAFGLKTRVWHSKRDNMWVCSTKNKIFCRFIEKIIGISPGKKSHIVKEPDIIKKSNLKIRYAFLSGMLSFDGCVKTNGIVSLTSMSKNIIKSAEEIFKKNDIKTNVYNNKKKKSWIIETSLSRNIKNHQKLLTFFEQDTYKYNRLKFFISSKTYSIEELVHIFPEEKKSKTSLKKVYNCAKKLKKFQINDLTAKTPVSKTTLYKYLYILNKSRILKSENKQIITNKNAFFKTTYTFIGVI